MCNQNCMKKFLISLTILFVFFVNPCFADYSVDYKLKLLDTITDTTNPVLIKIFKQNYCYTTKDMGSRGQAKIFMADILAGDQALDFISVIDLEGDWSTENISMPNKNGTRDYGLCQLNSRYHWGFISSPEFHDIKNQIKYCWDVFNENPNVFSTYKKRAINYHNFICPNPLKNGKF